MLSPHAPQTAYLAVLSRECWVNILRPGSFSAWRASLLQYCRWWNPGTTYPGTCLIYGTDFGWRLTSSPAAKGAKTLTNYSLRLALASAIHALSALRGRLCFKLVRAFFHHTWHKKFPQYIIEGYEEPPIFQRE